MNYYCRAHAYLPMLSSSSLSVSIHGDTHSSLAAAVPMLTILRSILHEYRTFGVSHVLPFNRRTSVECMKINKTASHGFYRLPLSSLLYSLNGTEREEEMLASNACIEYEKREKSESKIISSRRYWCIIEWKLRFIRFQMFPWNV